MSKSIIERMLDEGIIPIMSEEGINSLFDYILKCYKNGETFRAATSPSREIKLSNYKKPNDDIEMELQALLNNKYKGFTAEEKEYLKQELIKRHIKTEAPAICGHQKFPIPP